MKIVNVNCLLQDKCSFCGQREKTLFEQYTFSNFLKVKIEQDMFSSINDAKQYHRSVESECLCPDFVALFYGIGVYVHTFGIFTKGRN